MSNSLQLTYDVVERLSKAVTAQEICDGLISFTGRYGLTRMLAGILPAFPAYGSDVLQANLLVGAFPPEWLSRYFAQGYGYVDPVFTRCRHILAPFLWSEALPFTRPQEAASVAQMFGEASEFGLRAGLVVPILTLDGAAAAVSLAGERADVPSEARGMITMVSTFAAGHAFALRARETRRRHYKLTAREIECLKWAADGKSEWEIGEILCVSEHTVGNHLSNVRRKLGATTRCGAVASAMRLGYIF